MHKDFNKGLGMTRLELERRKRKWNQTQLAAQAGLTAAEISRYERRWAVPYPGPARRLATLLGLPEGQLLDEVCE